MLIHDQSFLLKLLCMPKKCTIHFFLIFFINCFPLTFCFMILISILQNHVTNSQSKISLKSLMNHFNIMFIYPRYLYFQPSYKILSKSSPFYLNYYIQSPAHNQYDQGQKTELSNICKNLNFIFWLND